MGGPVLVHLPFSSMEIAASGLLLWATLATFIWLTVGLWLNKALQQIQHLAYHDPLTGLINREAQRFGLTHTLAESSRNGSLLAQTDSAIHAAKQSGRGKFHFYDKGLGKRGEHRLKPPLRQLAGSASCPAGRSACRHLAIAVAHCRAIGKLGMAP